MEESVARCICVGHHGILVSVLNQSCGDVRGGGGGGGVTSFTITAPSSG